jgi:chromosome segregation ATPase
VKKSAFENLQTKNDSLTLINTQVNNELDQILQLLNEVEDNFRSIKSAENYLSVQSNAPGELTPSTRDRIQTDMQFITETLEKNRQQIDNLEKKLKSSNLKSSQLTKTIQNLRAELSEKTNALVALRDELAVKDQQIAELTSNVTTLSKDIQSLKVQTQTQEETITKQKTEINTVYYCFGTSSELKKQYILDGKQLGTNFNRDYFISVDMYDLAKVPLYAKKGQLISKHPEGSYEFGKDANNQAILYILDAKNFWSLTKYLVVLVNV